MATSKVHTCCVGVKFALTAMPQASIQTPTDRPVGSQKYQKQVPIRRSNMHSYLVSFHPSLYFALLYFALRCVALRCVALLCFALLALPCVFFPFLSFGASPRSCRASNRVQVSSVVVCGKEGGCVGAPARQLTLTTEPPLPPCEACPLFALPRDTGRIWSALYCNRPALFF